MDLKQINEQLENETKDLSRDVVRLQKNNKQLAEINNSLFGIIAQKLGVTEIKNVNEFLERAEKELTVKEKPQSKKPSKAKENTSKK